MKKEKLLIIFAKEPVKGKVKTRLAKQIGKEKALETYLSLLRKTFRTFKEAKHDVSVYFTPIKTNLKELAPRRFKFKQQKGKNLGSRMLNAFKEKSKKYEKTIIIGVDCPFTNKRLVNKAFASLSRYPVVLGPSHDGGYHLIGLSKSFPSIFQNISWGTNRVLRQTLKKCKLLKIKPHLLKRLYDIDTLNDLRKWRNKNEIF
jgi:rSAM/selenodomain-associated transferase 1